MPQIELVDLLKGIGHAIQEDQEYIDHHSIVAFGRYFTEEGTEDNNKTLCPKMIKLPLPDFKGGYIEREIPAVSLVNHDALHFDEVRIKMQVAGIYVSEPSDPQKLKLLIDNGALQERIEDDGETNINCMSIELTFKMGEPPEGTARVLNEIYKSVP
jgi:hypothetical protein